MAEIVRVGAVAMEKTSSPGNMNAGSAFDIKSTGRPVRWVQACWDGEVIKGIALKFHGSDTMHTVGDWNNGASQFFRSTLDIAEDDVLRSFSISTSNFGYKSVRGFVVQTRTQAQLNQTWNPGNVTDPHSHLDVVGRSWMGIFGCRNSDQFINALGLWVTTKKD